MQPVLPATAARLAEWKEQPEVVGVLLVGSRSRGHADALSDDDLEVYLTPEAFAARAPNECIELRIEIEGSERKLIYDAQYTTLADLERKVPSPYDLDHWPYERAPVLFDRHGSVSALVQAVGHMDPEFRHLRLLHATIDTWTAIARITKTRQRGAGAAARLLVARAARGLARIIFALEWRWVPLDHWLEAELRTLEDPTRAGAKLVEALKSGDPKPLDDALAGLEDRLFAEGVPRPGDRIDLFLELIHLSRGQERARHGLY